MRQPVYFQKLKTAADDRQQGGFTLIEMLVVVAIISLLLAIAVPVANSALQATALTAGGNQVTQVFEYARQRAMSGNVLTAVVLLTNQSAAGGGTATSNDFIKSVDGRALTVLEYVPPNPADPSSQSSWKQITEWAILPDGVAVDVSSNSTNANSFFSKSPSPFPFLKDKGAPVAYLGSGPMLKEGSYAARVFLPAGGLLNPNDPAQLQLVMGRVVRGVTQYQEKNGPVNYYRISLIGATGRTKVERPSL
jgi:prepilin-type N-terminal cleavage/methylation domain-containing protein